MPRANANGIELEYESIGNDRDPPVVLIMGLGSQMIVWPAEFCRMLADRGLRVIRFDNRDVGLSTRPAQQYTLDDMADDTAGLLDALALPDAHVVGISMGGFIAQLVAIRHPKRLRSLCVMMSSTGDRSVGMADPDILPLIMQPQPSDRDGYIEYRVGISRRLSSPGYPFDEARIRKLAADAYDRAYYPLGGQRQLAAVMGSPDRTGQLRDVRVPTLVMHGDKDAIVNVSGGEAVARAIPGAKLRVFPGLGHDMPAALWAPMVDAILENVRAA
jgi:pimeloyl-ACP methyl ester carboxylesterase